MGSACCVLCVGYAPAWYGCLWHESFDVAGIVLLLLLLLLLLFVTVAAVLLLMLLVSPMLLQLFALHLYKYILCLRRSVDVVDVVVCRTGCEDARRQETETETQVATEDWEADVELRIGQTP